MNETPQSPETLEGLVDDYLSDWLDEARFRRLEQWLLRDAEARRYFTLYCRTHTDMHVEARARRAGDRAVAAVAGSALSVARKTARSAPGPSGAAAIRRPFKNVWRVAAVAALLLVAGGTWWAARHTMNDSGPLEVAWLSNAQDCRWADAGPVGGLSQGCVLRLEHGLAEIRFRLGASVILEGPADLQLLSTNSARLVRGRLSANVPAAARGFQVLAPQGRVVDLGTEFGLAVAPDGSADVIVFKGRVEAYSGASSATALTENRSARIRAGKVIVDPGDNRPAAGDFARQIRATPNVSPRTLLLGFQMPVPGSLADSAGAGTGLDARLPGTGGHIPARDPNLRLSTSDRCLELTTTRSDLNTQFQLGQGEYLGTRLSTLGFTGQEDFEVTAVIPNIPSLAAVGQFGLYAGSQSDRNIRGGLISRGTPDDYKQFLVNNDGGFDHDSLHVGIIPMGSDVKMTLRRERGKYSLSVESLASGAASTLSIRHPAFLDGTKDLYVGLFAANTGSEQRRTIVVKEFKVTVWATAPGPGNAQK